jgi:ABC-type uncharacterized transport system permease subunit
MDSGVNMLCFTASYAVALALEVMGLWTRPRWRRLAVVLAAVAGLVAQTWYLGQRAVLWASAPLSSPHDWYLAAAWALAIIFLTLVLYQPKASTGVFLLPVMLALIFVARSAPRDAIASFEAPRFWGMVHGVFLMLGAVAVLMGFVAGVMYLVQSYRLKQKIPADANFRLPSLEWLERVNTRSLGAAAILVAVGFFTGVIARLATAGGAGVPWTDPVVLSLSGMMSWLVAAEAFRVAYPAARRGRKVAYLTLAAGVFLAFTLASFMRVDGVHRKSEKPQAMSGESRAQNNFPAPSPWRGGLGRGATRVHGLWCSGHTLYPQHHPSLTLPLKGRGPEGFCSGGVA